MLSDALSILRRMPALVRIGVAQMVAYRAELILWFLTASMPAVMVFIWDRVAASGPVGRFDQAGFARYFAAALVMRQLTATWVVWELNEQIRSGEISPRLLKPTHPLVFALAENAAAVPFRLVTMLPVVVLLAVWRPELLAGETSWVAWAALPLSVLLGFALQFMVQLAFGSLAFFLHQSVGLYMVWHGVFVLLSGFVLPVEVLPEPWNRVVEVLPFRAILGIPTEMAAGTLEVARIPAALGLQGFWLLVIGLVARALWKSGVRRYEAFGG